MATNYVIDLHCHPSLKTYLFNRNLEDDNHSGSGGNPVEYMFLDMLTDLPKLERGGVNTILSSVYLPEKRLLDECKLIRLALPFAERFRDAVNNDPYDMTVEILKHFEGRVERARSKGKKVRVAHSMSALAKAREAGEIAVLHAIEGAHSLGIGVSEDVSLSRLERFFNMGVCLLTLGHFYDNDVVSPVEGLPPSIKHLLCGTAKKDLSKGLSQRGEKVVEKMIQLGMLIDLTHCTQNARNRVFDINNNRSPLLFSHVGVYKNPMNPVTDEIRKIARCGGVIGVIFNTYWLRGRETMPIFEKDLGLNLIADNISVIAKYGGIDSVGIGTDLDGFTDPPDDVKDISFMPRVRDVLKQRGFTEAHLDKIFGGNAFRVLRDGWKKAASPFESAGGPFEAASHEAPGSEAEPETAEQPTESQSVVVTVRGIESALRVRHDSGIDSTAPGSVFESATTVDPETAGRMMAELNTALAALDASETVPGIMSSPQSKVGSLLQSYLAERAIERNALEPLATGGFEAKFDTADAGWIGDFFKWWLGGKDHPWMSDPGVSAKLGKNNVAKIAMLGDWGTGMYGAGVSANSIEKDGGFDLLMHLGDVYYSGQREEIQKRFLDLWPKVPGAINRALNSNHEMYSGGWGYFDMTLPRFDQSASFFTVGNDYWILAGLDTGYEDHDLAHAQADWLREIVESAGDRKVILFSHHQPFSRFDSQGPELQKKLSTLLNARKIFAWYWGHEHRCILYDQHPQWGLHGRCIGHGGIPYFRDDLDDLQLMHGPNNAQWRLFDAKSYTPGGRLLDGPNPYVVGHEEKYGPQGYAVLHFDNDRLYEVIHAPDGSILHDKEFTPAT